MKLGLLLFPAPRGSAQLARMAENMGFDSLVFADTQNITPEVWGQLMLAARDTERIELGTGVTNPGTRDVAVTASAALALQVESDGRAVCGIGRGDSSLGKIGRGPVSVQEFERDIDRLRRYLRGDSVDRDGTASRIEWHAEANVPPVPLEVAATGRRVIEVAARHADRIVFAVGADEERLARSIAIARGAAAASGRDPDQLPLGAWINAVVHPDVAAARAAVRGGLSAFAHFSGFSGMRPEAMNPALRDAALHLRETTTCAITAAPRQRTRNSSTTISSTGSASWGQSRRPCPASDAWPRSASTSAGWCRAPVMPHRKWSAPR